MALVPPFLDSKSIVYSLVKTERIQEIPSQQKCDCKFNPITGIVGDRDMFGFTTVSPPVS